MSKITLPIAELKPALAGLGKVIGKRATLPVLQHIKIERTAEGWLALTATDLDTFITVRLEQPGTGEPISMLVPYDELLKITRNCGKTDNILVGTDGKASGPSATIEYAIGNQVAESKVESLPAEEFPATPRMKGEPIALNDPLRLSIHDALECAGVDPTRMVLNGACLDVSKPKAHYVVGTNGNHLFSSNSFHLPLKDSLIIPSHKFIGWREFNNDGEWQLKVAPAETKDAAAWLQIASRRWRFITRQIDGIYPDWRHAVPDGKSTRATLALDPQQLPEILQTIERMPCHDAVNLTIGIEWTGKQMHLLGKASNAADWMRVPVEVHGMGPEITTFLNRQYLSKALGFGLNTIELMDARSPLRFQYEGRQMIVMPVRVETAPAPNAEPTPPSVPTPATADPNPPPQPAEQPKEENTMPETNGNTNGATRPGSATEPKPEAPKPALELALAQLEVVRWDFRNAIAGLGKFGDLLRQVQRGNKASDKEIQSVRATLRSLQSVRI